MKQLRHSGNKYKWNEKENIHSTYKLKKGIILNMALQSTLSLVVHCETQTRPAC